MSPAILGELATMLASGAHFHDGRSAAVGDYLAYLASAGQSGEVANALLAAFQRGGGISGVGDHGVLLALMGEVAPGPSISIPRA